MKQLNKFFLLSSIILLSACGTGTTDDIDDDRYDMWNYMAATVDYEVEYALYENGNQIDYYTEKHTMVDKIYKREGSRGVTTLSRHTRDIEMKEPSRNITVERYVHIGDNVFTSNSIKSCQLKQYYKNFNNKDKKFNNVILVSCLTTSGIKERFFYGYNEGIVSIYQDDNGTIKEWVKVKETSI